MENINNINNIRKVCPSCKGNGYIKDHYGDVHQCKECKSQGEIIMKQILNNLRMVHE
jgi:DnaJ-class molecular chaperone